MRRGRGKVLKEGDVTTIFNFCVPKSEREEFKKRCKLNKTDASTELRGFIQRYLAKS